MYSCAWIWGNLKNVFKGVKNLNVLFCVVLPQLKNLPPGSRPKNPNAVITGLSGSCGLGTETKYENS